MPEYKFKRQSRRIELSEASDLISSMPTQEFKAVISILYLSGARISEVLSLAPAHVRVDKKDNTVYVRFITLKRKDRKRKISFIPHERNLPFSLDSPFIDIFLDYVRSIENEEKLFSMSRVTVWKYIKKFNEFISPHSFRHSRLQKLADSNVSAHIIRMWAGHSKLDSSTQYIESSASALKPVSATLD